MIPTFRGLPWAKLKREYESRFENANDRAEIQNLIRGILGRLKASHIGLITPQDKPYRRAALPFYFERTGQGAFVSRVLRPRKGVKPNIQYGDELISVDEVPVAKVEMPGLRWLRPTRENPYFGKIGSSASVHIIRAGADRRISVKRYDHFAQLQPDEQRDLRRGIRYLRLLTLDAQALPQGRLEGLLKQVEGAKGLILDLRDCPGGDINDSLPVASALLGGGKTFFTIVPRGAQNAKSVRTYSSESPRASAIRMQVTAGYPTRLVTSEGTRADHGQGGRADQSRDHERG